jgi:putative ABC transport system permease protein
MPLGFRLLLHRKGRLLTAIAGIVMAVAITFVQAGMLSGVLEAQSEIANLMRADFVVMSALRSNLHNWTRIRTIRLDQIAAVQGVDHVTPIYQRTTGIRAEARPGRRREAAERPIRSIVVFAFPPDDSPLAIGDPARIEHDLRERGNLLFDRDSRPIYGAVERGGRQEMDDRNWRVAGFVDIGPDIVYDGAVVISSAEDRTRDPSEWPIMGAVHVKPGVDRDAVRAQILSRLPDDVSVLTPAEVRVREIGFTLRSVPIGILFGIGMLAGALVGALTCYQVMFNEITDHLKMYTMIRAMGFSEGFVQRIIASQAFLLSLLGFAAGAIAARGVAYYLANTSRFLVQVSPFYSCLILAGTIATCVAAGLLALHRVRASDPAELI